MSLVLPREEEVENMFSRILSSDRYCERLMDAFYDHLCDDKRTTDPDPHHFAEVLLGAYKNGDVSALLLELFNRSMFDLLKETYLIPKRFHGKNGENPVLLTDVDGNLLNDKALSPDMNIRNSMRSIRRIMPPHVPNSISPTPMIWFATTPPVWISARKRKTGSAASSSSMPCRIPKN